VNTSLRKIHKVLRFVTIYGFFKTFYKVMGRSRNCKFYRPAKSKFQDVAVIGCGQFSFSTLGFALSRKFGNRFLACYDVDKERQSSFESFYRLESSINDALELFENEQIKYVYITSNHYSHTDYAITALKKGVDAYVEKPICVNDTQFCRLVSAVKRKKSNIYAGYNRPFSKAVLDLKKQVVASNPFTVSCFVSGHEIAKDNWYRDPKEGTRVCGNIGHWLDLCVHMLSWGTLSDQWTISMTYSNNESRDDDVAISMASERGDLLNIVITSRCEPFEGINETINVQCGNMIAKIDDFRRMTVWQDEKLKKYRYWPKDVGHNKALLQPFSDEKRDWHEVELSTMLMLFVKNMVLSGERVAEFSFSKEYERLMRVGAPQ
jgi:predicted dehydrogenase